MKKEHIDLVWNSLNDFEKANMSFSDFLDRLGIALESASLPEAKLIGETARNLEFIMNSGQKAQTHQLIETLRSGLSSQNPIKANISSTKN
ncbi:MAG: hypothetical protein ACQETH_04030 [Candidatus Rifleibacteriota bacterium]